MRSLHPLAVDRRARNALGALFACALLLALAAPAALAGEPHVSRPLAPDRNSHTPHFVTETNDLKWDDCEWASAVMLIEKWTGERVGRRALRAASNVAKGGSSLRDVARGMAYLVDLHLRYSPGGGDPMTWRQLLARLADGGGAIVEGAYSRMPRWYQRWDRKFAASGSVKSAHAVFVERYEPRRGRVWLMDPLGRDGYNGEWISAYALEAFSYTSSGLVHAAATPARLPPIPLSRVKLGQPTLVGDVVAGSAATVVVPIAHDKRKPPRLAPLWIAATWQKVDAALPDGPIEPVPPATVAPQGGMPASPDGSAAPASVPSGSSLGGLQGSVLSSAAPSLAAPPFATGSPKRTALTAVAWSLTTRIVMPTAPGRYRLTLTLHDKSGRAISAKIAPSFLPIVVSVAGPYRITFDAPATLPIADQGLAFGVTNAGTAPWVAIAPLGAHRSGGPLATTPYVIAEWLFADGHTTAAGDVAFDLMPGASATVALPLPSAPSGAVALRLDFVGPDGRSISDQGGHATIVPVSPSPSVQEPS